LTYRDKGRKVKICGLKKKEKRKRRKGTCVVEKAGEKSEGGITRNSSKETVIDR